MSLKLRPPLTEPERKVLDRVMEVILFLGACTLGLWFWLIFAYGMQHGN